MRVDNVDAVLTDELTKLRQHAAIELPGAGQQVRLQPACGRLMMQLNVTAGGMGEDTEHAMMATRVKAAREIEDHGLCAVHAAAADELENLHRRSASLALETFSTAGSARFTMRQTRAYKLSPSRV